MIIPARTAAWLEGQRQTIRTDSVKATILAYLRIVPRGDVAHIAQDIGADAREVQDALHDLDDAGRVLMRNGWYRLSEAERARG